MPRPFPTPQHRILSSIAGVAEELLLDVAQDREPDPSLEEGRLYFYKAGMFNVLATLHYVVRRDAVWTFTLTTPEDRCFTYILHAEEAQAAVDEMAQQLIQIAGRDPQLTSAGPRRPRP